MLTRRSHTVLTLAAGPLFTVLFVAGAATAPHPRLTWNASASAPVGLYRLSAVSHPHAGTLVAVMPPPGVGRFLANRHYLALGVPLLKHVAARAGARVCRVGTRITIDGRLAAVALVRDRRGRPLPVWRGCRIIGRDELFLLNRPADSMDGRYFGPISATGLIGRATPVFTRDTPGEPLEWRGNRAHRWSPA